jgi:diaminopimelate decarboxylase
MSSAHRSGDEAGDVTDLLSVVDDVGTPVYIYDLAAIRTNQRRLRSALPEHARLYYPLSVNPHPELLREIRAGHAFPSVRSPGELDIALVAGWAAREVLYTGPAHRDQDVDWALLLGVRNFTVDSPDALDQLDRRAARYRGRTNCLLRVNTGAPARSGADMSWVLAEPDRFASRPNAEVVGLRLCTPPSPSVSTVDTGAVVREVAAALALRVREVQLDFPVVGLPGLPPQGLGFELGQRLVDSAGTLLTSVLDVRRMAGRQVVILESGANHVGGFYGTLAPRLVSRQAEADRVDTVVLGPQEIPWDVWEPLMRLPRLRRGDVMAVPNVGACGPTAGLVAFTAQRIPMEVVIDEDDPDVEIAHVSRLAVTRYPDDDRGRNRI